MRGTECFRTAVRVKECALKQAMASNTDSIGQDSSFTIWYNIGRQARRGRGISTSFFPFDLCTILTLFGV